MMHFQHLKTHIDDNNIETLISLVLQNKILVKLQGHSVLSCLF